MRHHTKACAVTMETRDPNIIVFVIIKFDFQVKGLLDYRATLIVDRDVCLFVINVINSRLLRLRIT